MKLTIKDIKTAKVFDVEIAAEPVSVEVLKMAIQASQHIEVANQKLVFKGKTLREGVKLGDVGVENGATVHLVLKLASASRVSCTFDRAFGDAAGRSTPAARSVSGCA